MPEVADILENRKKPRVDLLPEYSDLMSLPSAWISNLKPLQITA